MRQRHGKGPLAGSAARFRTGAAAWLARAGLVARAGYDSTARRVRTFSAGPMTPRGTEPHEARRRAAADALPVSVGRPRGRRGDRAADRHHAPLLGRQLGAFRLAGGEPRHARLRPDQRHHVRAQGLVRAALAAGGDDLADAVRSADGGGEPRRAADTLQRHLPRLRPGAEVAAVRQLPALHAPLPGRRLLPRHRLPQGAADLRPRLFRRPHGLGPLRAAVPGGDVFLHAREPADRAARAVVRRQRAVVRGRGAPAADRAGLARRPCACAAVHLAAPAFDVPNLAVSDYKGVSYARKFPDSERVYERASPFGYLEVYSSSYLHFAPGLSDNAAFNLPTMPANAYLGLYIDGEGPSGIIRDLPADETAYFRFLPMIYPYLIKEAPDTFVVQFGGGISTAVALQEQLQERDRGGGKPGRARRLPQRQGPARLHRRRPPQPEDQGHRLRGAPLSRPHHGPLRHHRSEPRRLRPACRTPAASPSSRSSPTRARP